MPRNDTSVLWIDLAGLPAVVNNDICVDVVCATRGINVSQCRRFMRAAIPAHGAAEPVQVDHHTKTFRVCRLDGTCRPFIGNGYYVGQHPYTNVTKYASVLRPHAQLGANMFVAEFTYSMTEAEKLELLDSAHSMGVKVIWSLRGKPGAPFPDGLGFGAGVFANMSQAEAMLASSQWEANVRGNISAVVGHPALLAWSICDDCCPLAPQLDAVSLQSRMYNLVKSIDPMHAVTGAVQCANAWLWSDVPSSRPPDPAIVTAAIIPFTAQPQLQLGMDFFCTENYKQLLKQHAGDGTWGPQGGEVVMDGDVASMTDGAFRNGIPFEILVNLPGLWQKSGFQAHPAAPRFKRSTMWLGVVNAEMVHSGALDRGGPNVLRLTRLGP